MVTCYICLYGCFLNWLQSGGYPFKTIGLHGTNSQKWFIFQIDGNGNYLFLVIKKSLQVQHSELGGNKDKECNLPYLPNHYFWHQVVNWMAKNCQKVMKYMGLALRASYWVPNPNASHGSLFSYKTYLSKLLDSKFWGDEVVVWSILMMCGLKITVINSKTLQKYRFHHDVVLWHVNVGLVYNSSTLYSAASESCVWSLV